MIYEIIENLLLIRICEIYYIIMSIILELYEKNIICFVSKINMTYNKYSFMDTLMRNDNYLIYLIPLPFKTSNDA